MDEYQTALERFRRDLPRFRPTSDHLVPDIALRGFLAEIEENAIVAAEIAQGKFPHRGFPNARSAFEAAQLANLMITDEDYDLAGARAWVYHLRKDRDFALMEGHAAKVGDSSTGELSPQEWFDEAVKEMSETWEEFCPGKGAVISAARALVVKQKPKPDNWAGVSIGKELGKRFNELAQERGMPNAVENSESALGRAYAAMCRGTHPRPSLRPQRIARPAEGGLIIEFEIPDLALAKEMVLILLAGSLNFGISAIHSRLRLGAA